MRDPQTSAEWREAVDSAQFFLALDSCRQFGLLEGGPSVNVERCEEIIRRGEKLGFRPAPIEQLAVKKRLAEIETDE